MIIRGSGQYPLGRKYCYLEFLMNDIPEAVQYEVDEEDGEHLQRALLQQEDELIPYFFFTAKDDRHVIVSIRDIQMVNILWETSAYNARVKSRTPKIEIYFRGKAKPYEDFLGDPGWLPIVYDSETFGIEEPFLSFINVDDDEIFFSPEQVVLLSFSWGERINQTTIETIAGVSDFGSQVSGTLGAHVWQRAGEEDEEQDEGWYAHVDFVEDDEDVAHDYEFDTCGPFATKSEAIEVIRRDFEWLARMVIKKGD